MTLVRFRLSLPWWECERVGMAHFATLAATILNARLNAWPCADSIGFRTFSWVLLPALHVSPYVPTYIHAYMHTYISSYMQTCILAYLHTCIHAYMHIYIQTYTRAYMHTCIHAYIHFFVHAYLHTFIHAYMHIYIQTYTRAYMHTCIHAYMHTCIHAYMHTCMHTYQTAEVGAESKCSCARDFQAFLSGPVRKNSHSSLGDDHICESTDSSRISKYELMFSSSGRKPRISLQEVLCGTEKRFRFQGL